MSAPQYDLSDRIDALGAAQNAVDLVEKGYTVLEGAAPLEFFDRLRADRLDDVIANESPEQAKELLRLLVKEIRVHNRRRILPTTAFRRRFAQYLVRWSVPGSNQ